MFECVIMICVCVCKILEVLCVYHLFFNSSLIPLQNEEIPKITYGSTRKNFVPFFAGNAKYIDDTNLLKNAMGIKNELFFKEEYRKLGIKSLFLT